MIEAHDLLKTPAYIAYLKGFLFTVSILYKPILKHWKVLFITFLMHFNLFCETC